MLCFSYLLLRITTINARFANKLLFWSNQLNGLAKRSEIVRDSFIQWLVWSGFPHWNSNRTMYSSVSQLQSWRATYQNILDVSPIKTLIQLISFLVCVIGRHLRGDIKTFWEESPKDRSRVAKKKVDTVQCRKQNSNRFPSNVWQFES